MLEHVIEVCGRDFTMVFRSQVRTFGLEDNSRYGRGFLGLVVRDRYIVALAGLIDPVLLAKNSQLLIPICLAE
jgi:hypothetical protein